MALECGVPLVFLGPFWFLLGFLPVVSLFGFSLPLSTAILNTYLDRRNPVGIETIITVNCTVLRATQP